jgi:hypothetical protein
VSQRQKTVIWKTPISRENRRIVRLDLPGTNRPATSAVRRSPIHVVAGTDAQCLFSISLGPVSYHSGCRNPPIDMKSTVSRSVAMKLTGHKTEAVYRRYAITSAADLSEGVGKLATLHSGSVAPRTVLPFTKDTMRAQSTA